MNWWSIFRQPLTFAVPQNRQTQLQMYKSWSELPLARGVSKINTIYFYVSEYCTHNTQYTTQQMTHKSNFCCWWICIEIIINEPEFNCYVIYCTTLWFSLIASISNQCAIEKQHRDSFITSVLKKPKYNSNKNDYTRCLLFLFLPRLI